MQEAMEQLLRQRIEILEKTVYSYQAHLRLLEHRIEAVEKDQKKCIAPVGSQASPPVSSPLQKQVEPRRQVQCPTV
jgi:hypothetical protein